MTRVLILGGDGYLGWPTAMHFANKGHEVMIADNYLRRQIAKDTSSEALIEGKNMQERCALFAEKFGKEILWKECDLSDPEVMFSLFKEFKPDAVVHYAEQPSAPYSMMDFNAAQTTMNNNLGVTFNLIWAVKDICPNCHIIKLGTMGEYGTPNIDIEEGWLDVEHKGRKHTFLYPRQAGSLYHTTKVLDTDLLWFYVRTYGLRVTDLMQGPVYGLMTEESTADDGLLPNFHYDDIFGTVVNRFLVQAIAGVPLTVYGKGGQTRGYLNLKDTLQCIELAVNSPVKAGDLRILNQLTETFTVLELADKVSSAAKKLGYDVAIKSIPNPRKEAEEHYYNPTYSGLMELGLKPHHMNDEVLVEMLDKIIQYKDRIDVDKIMPRVAWAA
ncbi:MAG: NAD-dependent epimerase/dehydratase family protein [Rickettsiales bacterium]